MTFKNFASFVLAVYPSSRGIAYVLFEGPLSPFDWAVKEFRTVNKNTESLRIVESLIERYRPDAIVIEDWAERGSQRSLRIRRLYRTIAHAAAVEHVDCYRYSKSQIRSVFASLGASSRYEMAQAIARQIPAFSHRIPRIRKIWMSEDGRQYLFNAAALGMTHYALHQSDYRSPS